MTGKPDKLASALLKISGKIKVIPPKELENVQKLNAFFILNLLLNILMKMYSAIIVSIIELTTCYFKNLNL